MEEMGLEPIVSMALPLSYSPFEINYIDKSRMVYNTFVYMSDTTHTMPCYHHKQDT